MTYVKNHYPVQFAHPCSADQRFQIEYMNNDNIAFSMNQFGQNFRVFFFFSLAIIFLKFLNGIEEKAHKHH